MAQNVSKSWTLPQYKVAHNLEAIELFTARKSGKRYACRKDTGEFIGMLADDFDKAKPVSVLQMHDTDTAETWLFICNGEPRVAEDTL